MNESRTIALSFPLYLVFWRDILGWHDPYVVNVGGRESVVLFSHQELAELFIEQQLDRSDHKQLRLHHIESDEDLRRLVASLPIEVGHALWNSTSEPKCFQLIRLLDFISHRRATRDYFTT